MSFPAFLSLPLSEIGESPRNPRSDYDLLLSTLRVKPSAVLAEVTERYAPKPEKKVAKKVRMAREVRDGA